MGSRSTVQAGPRLNVEVMVEDRRQFLRIESGEREANGADRLLIGSVFAKWGHLRNVGQVVEQQSSQRQFVLTVGRHATFLQPRECRFESEQAGGVVIARFELVGQTVGLTVLFTQ